MFTKKDEINFYAEEIMAGIHNVEKAVKAAIEELVAPEGWFYAASAHEVGLISGSQTDPTLFIALPVVPENGCVSIYFQQPDDPDVKKILDADIFEILSSISVLPLLKDPSGCFVVTVKVNENEASLEEVKAFLLQQQDVPFTIRELV